MEEMKDGWKKAGRIALQDAQLTLPDIPSDPGLYRLRFESGAVYIGEANNLRRRLGDYLLYYLATGIESEYRLNKRLKDEGGASVDILCDESFSSKSSRCIREHAEIKKERAEKDAKVLNGGSIRDRIEFHRFEIVRLENRLRKTEAVDQGVDLDELMHAGLLKDEHANTLADELAIRSARQLGFGDDVLRLLGRQANDPNAEVTGLIFSSRSLHEEEDGR